MLGKYTGREEVFRKAGEKILEQVRPYYIEDDEGVVFVARRALHF